MTGERALRAVLVALVAGPALAVTVGLGGGAPVFFEYRETKLAAALFLGTLFVAAFVGIHGAPRSVRWSAATLRRSPELVLFAALLAWMTASGLWVEVRPNWGYELRQYGLFLAVALLLRSWADSRRGVALLSGAAICAATAVLVAVGLAQAAGLLPWLRPIDPGYGVGYPSLLGYKNPMALAVVGQIVLLPWLAGRAMERVRGRPGRWLLLGGLGTLFAVECAYVAFLKSRTAYLSLGVALVGLLAVAWRARRRGRSGAGGGRTPAAAAPALLAALAVLAAAGARAGAFSLAPDLRARAASLATEHVGGWRTSDRVTYLVNSVAMARDRPLGVGLGEWQTWYPVYRAWNPEVAFSDRVQPRRAHDDHAQVLAELGVPGFLLWAAFWAALLWRAFVTGARDDPFGTPLLGLQLLVFAVAMAGDFVLEHPYLKLQFFLVLALLPTGGGRLAEEPPREAARPAGTAWAVRALLAALVVAAAWEAWGLAARVGSSGFLRSHYLRLAEGTSAGLPPGALEDELGATLAAGEGFLRGRGHAKDFFKDYLLVAEAEYLAGRPERAHELAWESLGLHPYNTQAFELLAAIWAPVDADHGRAFERARRHVLDGPARGFDVPYPERRALR